MFRKTQNYMTVPVNAVVDDFEEVIYAVYDSDEMMIHAVEVRLQRWQELLKKENRHGISIESQMGLFSELSFLKSHFLYLESGS